MDARSGDKGSVNSTDTVVVEKLIRKVVAKICGITGKIFLGISFILSHLHNLSFWDDSLRVKDYSLAVETRGSPEGSRPPG